MWQCTPTRLTDDERRARSTARVAFAVLEVEAELRIVLPGGDELVGVRTHPRRDPQHDVGHRSRRRRPSGHRSGRTRRTSRRSRVCRTPPRSPGAARRRTTTCCCRAGCRPTPAHPRPSQRGARRRMRRRGASPRRMRASPSPGRGTPSSRRSHGRDRMPPPLRGSGHEGAARRRRTPVCRTRAATSATEQPPTVNIPSGPTSVLSDNSRRSSRVMSAPSHLLRRVDPEQAERSFEHPSREIGQRESARAGRLGRPLDPTVFVERAERRRQVVDVGAELVGAVRLERRVDRRREREESAVPARAPAARRARWPTRAPTSARRPRVGRSTGCGRGRTGGTERGVAVEGQHAVPGEKCSPSPGRSTGRHTSPHRCR